MIGWAGLSSKNCQIVNGLSLNTYLNSNRYIANNKIENSYFLFILPPITILGCNRFDIV